MRSKINAINLRSEPLLRVEGMAWLALNKTTSCWRNLFKPRFFCLFSYHVEIFNLISNIEIPTFRRGRKENPADKRCKSLITNIIYFKLKIVLTLKNPAENT